MVEVGLDQEVGAKDRRRRDMGFESGRIKGVRGGCEVSSPTTKSLLPLWPGAVGDRGDFCRSGGARQRKRFRRRPPGCPETTLDPPPCTLGGCLLRVTVRKQIHLRRASFIPVCGGRSS